MRNDVVHEVMHDVMRCVMQDVMQDVMHNVMQDETPRYAIYFNVSTNILLVFVKFDNNIHSIPCRNNSSAADKRTQASH